MWRGQDNIEYEAGNDVAGAIFADVAGVTKD
jgi:hypothetical protein